MNNEFIQSLIAEGLNSYAGSPFLRIKRNIALDLIIDKAAENGLSICFNDGKYFELRGRGKSVVFHQNAPENSVVAKSITPNKSRTKRILTQHNLPVPAGQLFDDYEMALRYFSACELPQVVKPNAGARSNGVTSNISTVDEFNKAWEVARKVQEEVIVEDYIGGDYLRVFVIGGQAMGAYVCVPAYVVGNGSDSIETLIQQKNKLRSLNPASMARKNHISRVDLLKEKGLTLESIPAAAQRVELTAVANIGAGGESIEVVDRIHPSLLELAAQSVRVIPGLHVAGVDLIVKDYQKPWMAHNAVILEINSNPAIDDHVFPMYGKPVDIPGLLIEFVLRDKRIGRKIDVADFPRYVASCDGRAFSRNYGVQMEVIKQAAYRHNLRVEDLSGFVYTLSSTNQSVTFDQGMSDRTTSVSRTASNRKDWTKRLLKSSGVITPQGESFALNESEQAWRFAEAMGRPVVVKPRSGSGGAGVSVNVSTRDHFELAWDVARKSKPKMILVEEFFSANDYRLLVVDDRVCAAAQRIPAYLVGDGLHTVQALIDRKNKNRRTNPYLGAKLIKITDMIEFNLRQQGITVASVLKAGQTLRLHSVANIGSGGESRDVSEIMHTDFSAIAVKARKAVFGVPYAGIDLLAEDITKAPHEQRWMVIEVNTNPDLALHHFPSEGSPRDAAGAVVGHLFPEILAADTWLEKSVKVVVKGKVDDVGFDKWVWRNAHLHALCGWVRSNPDGSVESLFRGTPNAVDHMVSLCRTGPKRAVVDALTVHPCAADDARGFVIHKTAVAIVRTDAA